MLKLALTFCLLFSSSFAKGEATWFSKLVAQNAKIKNAADELKILESQVEEQYSTYSWSLNYKGSYTDSHLESSSTFRPFPYKSIAEELSFSRPLTWGANFSVGQRFTQTSYPQGSSFLAAGPESKLYASTQFIQYTQNIFDDFFGQRWRDFERSLEAKKRAQMWKSSLEQDQILAVFYEKLIDLFLQRALLANTEQALKRAKERDQLVKKWTRDGLRDSVDVIVSEADFLAQKEQLEQRQDALTKTEQDLREYLEISHEQSLDFLDHLNLESWANSFKRPQGQVKDNKELLLKKQSQEEYYWQKKVSSQKERPVVQLFGEAEFSDYNTDAGTAFKEAVIGKNQNQWSAGLQISWQFGAATANEQTTQWRLREEMAVREISNLSRDLPGREKTFIDSLNLLDKRIDSVKKRLSLLEKAQGEYQKLYKQGRVDLDILLRTEEKKLQTENVYLEYLKTRELLGVQLAQVYGRVKNYLLSKEGLL